MGVPRQGNRQKTFIDRLDVLEAGLVPWPKSGAVACLDASFFYEMNWKNKYKGGKGSVGKGKGAMSWNHQVLGHMSHEHAEH